MRGRYVIHGGVEIKKCLGRQSGECEEEEEEEEVLMESLSVTCTE